MSKVPNILKDSPAVEAVVDDTSLKHFAFRTPIPLPMDGSSAMEVPHNIGITLDEKEQPLMERFTFQPPISMPLDGTSTMEASYKAGITLGEKEQPLEKRLVYQSPIPMPLDGSSASHNARITLEPLEKRIIYQSPIPMPLAGSLVLEAFHKAGINLDKKREPLEKPLSFQSPIPKPLDSRSTMETSQKALITLDEKKQSLDERFSFKSPKPIPSAGNLTLKASHNTRITLDGKGHLLEEPFIFQAPTPLPLEGCSSIETSHKARIALDEKKQPLEKPFNSQPPSPLPSNTRLAMDALLANNRLFEAFHKARITLDEKGQPLVEHFFRHCIENNRFKVLAELCLNEDEEQMVYQLLLECGSRQAETVHLILLLQNNKYIDAVKFMEYVSAKRDPTGDALNKLMLAYRSTMSPVTRGIADTYLRVHGKQGMDLANVPNVERRGPLSCQLARQKPSDIKSSVVSTLWAENHVEGPMNVHSNVPFLRTQHYGSSETTQRLRTVRPVPYRTLGKRHSELKEPDEEPSSKRFRFQPPISLDLDDSTPKKARADEKITDIEEVAKKKVMAPSVCPQTSGVPAQGGTGTEVHGQSLTLSLDPPRSHSLTDPETPKRMILNSGQSTSQAPITERSVVGAQGSPSESEQSRLGRTARSRSSQLNDSNTNINLEFRLRQSPIPSQRRNLRRERPYRSRLLRGAARPKCRLKTRKTQKQQGLP